jgi:hypothetical protein
LTDPRSDERVIAVHEALTAAGIPHAIGGAIALGHYAEPRPIRDIDVNVFVTPERRPEVEAALAGTGSDGPPSVSSSPRTRSTRRCPRQSGRSSKRSSPPGRG